MSELILEKPLPKGWAVCILDDIANEINSGFPSGRHNKEQNGIPHIRPMNIDYDGNIDLSDLKYVEKNLRDNLTKGDVLFNNTNSPKLLGKTTLIKQDTNWAYSNHMTRIRFVNDFVEPAYIAFYLHKLFLEGYYKIRATNHVNQSSINSTYLSTKVSVLLPPLNEQKRIVTKIEELFSKLDSILALVNRTKLQLKQYRQSLIISSTDGTLFKDEIKYEKKPISEIIESLGQGWSPRCENSTSMNDSEWAVMKTTAIQPLKFLDEENKKLPPSLEPRIHLEIKLGDILITRAGPRSRVGITCLVRKTRKRLLLCDKAYRIRCNKKMINPSFLELMLNSPHIIKEIDVMKTGINDSGVNITQDKFSNLIIPIPSLDDQTKIVMVLENVFSQIDKHESFVESCLKQCHKLRGSILKNACVGRLVLQDPNDESAEILLERIKQAKQQVNNTIKPWKKKNGT